MAIGHDNFLIWLSEDARVTDTVYDSELCAGDGDYTPWTKRYVCAFCHVDVTADNIGLTLNFHICDKCIHKDEVLEFLESLNEEHESEYQGWLDEPKEEENW